MSCRPNYATELPKDCLRELYTLALSGELAARWRDAAHAAFAVWSYLQPIVLGGPGDPLRLQAPVPRISDAEAAAHIERLVSEEAQASLQEEAARLLLNWLFERILSQLFGGWRD